MGCLITHVSVFIESYGMPVVTATTQAMLRCLVTGEKVTVDASVAYVLKVGDIAPQGAMGTLCGAAGNHIRGALAELSLAQECYRID
ncbi:hypothetical protein M514_08651 [Trichuris suis]|uniref:Uncharacterized protein n=1 Tax=Trichuris suis TaxID=68888 RepID=A0A085LZM8_9BILA|nr:hypothetical protein M513_08651 [Trichuris suis]KFD64022.1 hypothetical protein M514_08651 [Trichuris suis]